MKIWTDFWDQQRDFTYLIERENLRLPTVLALKGPEEKIQALHARCQANGIELGKGYGEWKNTTFRIANFPAHTIEDIETLINQLTYDL